MIITNRQLILTHEEFSQLAEVMWRASQLEEPRINPFAPTNPEYAQVKYRQMASHALGFFNNLTPSAEREDDATKNTA